MQNVDFAEFPPQIGNRGLVGYDLCIFDITIEYVLEACVNGQIDAAFLGLTAPPLEVIEAVNGALRTFRQMPGAAPQPRADFGYDTFPVAHFTGDPEKILGFFCVDHAQDTVIEGQVW